ncbi:MAG: DUF4332 domain-containing protein [Candidatus Limnocylindrales bacterium]
MPPIDHLLRPSAHYLDKLERQGLFTTGLLLEVSETPARRQNLADQVGATTNDVNDWRDEALLLNLANFGPAEQVLFAHAGITGLRDLLALDLDAFAERIAETARRSGTEPPPPLVVEGWWEQAQTLHEG